MEIKCLIVDDNINELELIKQTITDLSFQTDLDFNCTLLQDPLSLDKQNRYDIYIFDIDMPLLDGFTLAESIYRSYPDAVIMFCTSHEDFVFESYRANAFYFIRKDHMKEEMKDALRKYMSRITDSRYTYIVHSNRELILLSYESIICFEKHKDYLQVHTENHTYTDRDVNMDAIEKETSPASFIRISRSMIINPKYISRVSGDLIVLSNSMEITVPKRNVSAFMQKYFEYLRR